MALGLTYMVLCGLWPMLALGTLILACLGLVYMTILLLVDE